MSVPSVAWAPLASFADEVLLVIRLIMGVTMVYYGWPRVRDPKKNAADFDLLLLALALLAFGPGEIRARVNRPAPRLRLANGSIP